MSGRIGLWTYTSQPIRQTASDWNQLPSGARATIGRFCRRLQARSFINDREWPVFAAWPQARKITLWRQQHSFGSVVIGHIAQLRYDPLSLTWTLWNPVGFYKWRLVEQTEPVDNLERLLFAIYHNMFWGPNSRPAEPAQPGLEEPALTILGP